MIYCNERRVISSATSNPNAPFLVTKNAITAYRNSISTIDNSDTCTGEVSFRRTSLFSESNNIFFKRLVILHSDDTRPAIFNSYPIIHILS
jgi:hypothetical protein